MEEVEEVWNEYGKELRTLSSLLHIPHIRDSQLGAHITKLMATHEAFSIPPQTETATHLLSQSTLFALRQGHEAYASDIYGLLRSLWALSPSSPPLSGSLTPREVRGSRALLAPLVFLHALSAAIEAAGVSALPLSAVAHAISVAPLAVGYQHLPTVPVLASVHHPDTLDVAASAVLIHSLPRRYVVARSDPASEYAVAPPHSLLLTSDRVFYAPDPSSRLIVLGTVADLVFRHVPSEEEVMEILSIMGPSVPGKFISLAVTDATAWVEALAQIKTVPMLPPMPPPPHTRHRVDSDTVKLDLCFDVDPAQSVWTRPASTEDQGGEEDQGGAEEGGEEGGKGVKEVGARLVSAIMGGNSEEVARVADTLTTLLMTLDANVDGGGGGGTTDEYLPYILVLHGRRLLAEHDEFVDDLRPILLTLGSLFFHTSSAAESANWEDACIVPFLLEVVEKENISEHPSTLGLCALVHVLSSLGPGAQKVAYTSGGSAVVTAALARGVGEPGDRAVLALSALGMMHQDGRGGLEDAGGVSVLMAMVTRRKSKGKSLSASVARLVFSLLAVAMACAVRDGLGEQQVAQVLEVSAELALDYLSEPSVFAAALDVETAAASVGVGPEELCGTRLEMLTLSVVGFGEYGSVVKPKAVSAIHALFENASDCVRATLIESELVNSVFAALVASAPLPIEMAGPGVELLSSIGAKVADRPWEIVAGDLDVTPLVDFVLLVVGFPGTSSEVRDRVLCAASDLARAPGTCARFAHAIAPSLPLLLDSALVLELDGAGLLFAALVQAPELDLGLATPLSRAILYCLMDKSRPGCVCAPPEVAAPLLEGLVYLARRETWGVAPHFVSLDHVRWLVRAYRLISPEAEVVARRSRRAARVHARGGAAGESGGTRRARALPLPPDSLCVTLAGVWPALVDAYASPFTPHRVEAALIAGFRVFGSK